MSLLTNIALGVGLGTITAGYAAHGVPRALSSQHSDGWDWQYKGALFQDRVGNSTPFSDNKSRYNTYLKNFNESKVGYSFNLSDYDVQTNANKRIVEQTYTGNTSYSNNPNLSLIGNPTGANTTDSNNYILENKVEGRSQFVTSYNDSKGRPNWVAFKITKNNLGSVDRQNDFRHDPNLPSTFKIIDSKGFKGFDRGHMANSAAFTSSIGVNSSTYVMTNMMPQASNVNSGPWKDLEHYLNDTVKGNIIDGFSGKDIQIITGGSGKGGIGKNGYVETINGVEVPKVLWKVAVILEPGQTEITRNAKTISVIMPNSQSVREDWRNYVVPDGKKVKELSGIKRLFPHLSEEMEEDILDNLYDPEANGKSLLNIDLDNINESFESKATINARAKGIHNPLLTPLYDTNKEHQGLVISNKRTHSEQFELARYNASMRASGRFSSVVDAEDMGTYEGILRASKTDNKLTSQELAVAKAFDYAVNTPSLMSRMNEFFFIPAGMGRVLQEEKGIVPSLFGAVGGLIDQAYLTNNPALRSYKNDGENYFTTKTSFFQDLLTNSAATVLATASSIGVYLAVGEPLKAMASKALLNSQENLINASNTHNSAKLALGGGLNNNIGFKMGVIERQLGGQTSAYYDLNNPTFSLYYLENYQRQRGSFFFSSTSREFLLNKVNPYTVGSDSFKSLVSAVNDYVEVLQSPADIKIFTRTNEAITSVQVKPTEWHTQSITVSNKISPTGKLNIKDAVGILRGQNPAIKATTEVVQEINDSINKNYHLKITNVSIERNMMLAKKIQGIINLVPMPWAWGIFAGTKDKVTSPMIGNLLDIEGFARHINSSLNNQGFWGAANEYMLYSNNGNKASNPAFRIVNHLATFTRSMLAFNDNAAQSKIDLEDISKIGNTYSQAQIKIEDNLNVRTKHVKADYVNRSTKGYDVFNTDVMDVKSVQELLDNEAAYQDKWKSLASKRKGLNSITLEADLYNYANKSNNKLGFLLNHLDKTNSYMGMKIASGKLSAAKWIIGALFIPQLIGTEFTQSTGASLLSSTLAQFFLNKGTTNQAVELQSTNFFSAAEVAKMMGADNHVANFVLGTQSLVTMAGMGHWAWQNSANNTEVNAKMMQGQALFDSIDEVNNIKITGGLSQIQQEVMGLDNATFKTKTGGAINFNIIREGDNIVGLKSLNAKVAKNLTSFSVSLGLTLAAMQTARYVISSAINNERNLMGSAVLSFYGLAVPAVVLGAAATFDNLVHTANMLTGGKVPGLYNNYKATSTLVRGGLGLIQGVANVFGRAGTPLSLIGIAATAAAVTGAYWMKLTPFQGDLNGPKLDETNQTAISKLGEYVRQVNANIDKARIEGGSTNVSESISPLEVNGALLAIALGKIINPITSSQKGSTAYVTAVQSPLPIFQHYSVIKKVVDSTGNSYTTVNLGLQGPPAIGIAPINVSLPIAFAMNAKSSDNTTIKTGYLGTGFILNENNKDSLSLQDYYDIYSKVSLASSIAITVSSGLTINRLWGRNHQILKSNGLISSGDSLMTQSLKAGRDKFLAVGALPFYIAAQSINLTTGDLRMPNLRLKATAAIPAIFSAFMGGVLGNHLSTVLSEASQPFGKKKEDNLSKGLFILGGGVLFGLGSYYKGTIQAAQRLTKIEHALDIEPTINRKKIDFITRSMYSSPLFKGLNTRINNLSSFGGLVTKQGLGNNVGKALGLLAAGAFWNHFITDPTAGKVNPELAFKDITKNYEDTYSNSVRRNTTIAGGALLFAVTAGLSTWNAKSLIFADVNQGDIVEKFRTRVNDVYKLQELQKTSKLSVLQRASLGYQKYKLNLEAREVQIIIEEGMGNNPLIQAVKTAEGHVLKDASYLKDPVSEVRKITSNRSNDVFSALQRLDTSAGNDLQGILKNTNEGSKIIDALDNFGDKNLTGSNFNKNRLATLTALGYNKSATNRIHIDRWARLGTITASFLLASHSANWISQGMGYKDFQDAFMGADENNPGWWAQARQGIVDLVKLQTKHDRAHSYDIAKGLVGPNLNTSNGEFLLNPDSTAKGAISNSLKQLSKLIVVNAPNTFIGVAIGGVTVRPDDNDVRVRGYFQLQSASQDFSSAMYSMSSVFGLQELSKKGFLPQQLIAGLRGIDEAMPSNQAQLRHFATSIITAVYSQPGRSGKDRIRFTSPNNFTLEAMTTNKALSMSLSRRYKALQSLSYGTNTQIALYTLMNNMNIASPEMQGTFYKALMDMSNNNQLGLGKLNQNFFMGNGITVNQISNISSGGSPFLPAKFTEQEVNNENAFMEMQGIALQATTDQYLSNKNLGERLIENFNKFRDNSALQGIYQALPPFMWVPLALVGMAGVALLGITLSINSINSFSTGQATKDNTTLWNKQSQYYDEGEWFSKDKIIKPITVQGENTKYLLMKRTNIIFNIGEGFNDKQIKEYTQQINKLSNALSNNFDTAYRDYSKNYGSAYDDYLLEKKSGAITQLDSFYDQLEAGKAPSTTTRLSTKEDRLSRAYGREFKPIMMSEAVDQTIIYGKAQQRITEHILDEFVNKQVLDAYLEGQFDAFKEYNLTLTKKDFIDQYYKGYSYDDMLNKEADKFLSKASDKFTGNFNIFGKDRNHNMKFSVEYMTDVYAAKFDIIVDKYFDEIDNQVTQAFLKDGTDNVYSKFGSNELNGRSFLDEAEVKALSTNQRFRHKESLRSNINSRLTSTMSIKKTGWDAVFDRLLNLVSGGRTKDLINRMSLEASDAAIETMNSIRQKGGNVFSGAGNVTTTELSQEAAKAIEVEIKANSRSGLQGSIPAGNEPTVLKTQTSSLKTLETIGRGWTTLIAGYQATMFISTNLITFRAAASIASSKTGAREKEMAREEAAKEGFDFIFGALFFGTLLMSEQVKKYGMPGAGALAVGFIGYDWIFKSNNIAAGVTGIGAMGASIQLFKSSKTWGVSLGLMGITLLGRSIFNASGSSASYLSPEIGDFLSKKVEEFNYWGRDAIKSVHGQSGIINTIGGGTLAIAGLINTLKTKNWINGAVGLFGLMVGLVGFGHLTDSSNNKLEGASLMALNGLAQAVVTPFVMKQTGNMVSKTIASKFTQEILENVLIQKATDKIKLAGASRLAQTVGIRGAINVARFGALGVRGLAGVAAGPWGLAFTLATTAIEILMLLNSPETADDLSSNISTLGRSIPGGEFLLRPTNQIYGDAKYKDKDPRNPLFQGTVTDAVKQEWLAQLDTLDDVTGRKTANRHVTSFDAPMIGYNATSEGYGPGSLDPVQDFALAIRGKAYNSLVTGRQFWNTRMTDKMNHEMVVKYMTITERAQIQSWEGQINNTIDRENRKITAKPVLGSKEINAIGTEVINTLKQINPKLSQAALTIQEINNKKNLVISVTGTDVNLNPELQMIDNGNTNVHGATKVTTTKSDTGQKVLEFKKVPSRDSEQITMQQDLLMRNKNIERKLLNNIA